jgi:acetyl esterase/lipase
MSQLIKRLLSFCPLLLTTGCSSIDILNALSAVSSYSVEKDINYGNGNRQQLDIYYPKKPLEKIEKNHQLKTKDSKPVVIFLYGGSWNCGQRKDYAFVGHALASKGIITVIPDYRLYPEVQYPDFLKDNAAAVAWVIKNIELKNGDKNNLFIMGHSAGAYNAAMIALDNRWLAPYELNPKIFKGWIGISGPYDFYPVENSDVKPVFFHPDYPNKSQPIEFLNNQSIPSFLATSHQDDLVNPKRNTLAMGKKLNDLKVINTVKIYSKVDHISIIASLAWPLRFKSTLLEDLNEFIMTQKNKN